MITSAIAGKQLPCDAWLAQSSRKILQLGGGAKKVTKLSPVTCCAAERISQYSRLMRGVFVKSVWVCDYFCARTRLHPAEGLLRQWVSTLFQIKLKGNFIPNSSFKVGILHFFLLVFLENKSSLKFPFCFTVSS